MLSKLRLTARKLSPVTFIFESDFRTQNFSFSPAFMGCARRWIFFESDFRTPNFSFSLPFLGCGRRWIVLWVRFSDPKSFFEPTNLLIVADAAYFLWVRSVDPKFFVFRDYLRPMDLLMTFESGFSLHISADLTTTFESDSRTLVNRSICVKFLNNSRITYFVIRMSIYVSKLTYWQILCVTDLITLYRELSE